MGTPKVHKCKGLAQPGGRAPSNLVPKYYGQGSETCTCDAGDYLPGHQKKFFKKHKAGYPCNHSIHSVAVEMDSEVHHVDLDDVSQFHNLTKKH